MQKRGQLTIFVLAAILILVGIATVIFFVNKSQTDTVTDDYFKQQSIRTQVDNIREYTADCIDSVTKESLILVAVQGGYFTPPSRIFSYSPIFFPYYYYEGQINLPTLENIQKELGKSTNDKIIKCLEAGNFTGFNLDFKDPKTDVVITKQNAYFEIDMPLEIEKEGHKMIIELDDFSINHNSSLFEMYEIAAYMTNSHKEDSEYYCISCVADMAKDRNLYVYLFPNIANELITGVMIYENTTGIADPYSFIFFNKYTGEEKTPKLDV